MAKVEDLQQYGKDQFEAAVSAANGVQQTLQAIVTAFGDYSKKSFEDGNAFFEKLAASKSFDKALEVQSEYIKTSFETFVAESQKIGGLYVELAKQSFKPLEGVVGKFAPVTVQ
ncbi:MAG: phasin family protein [Xanthobacteraceae bacterium]